MKFPDSERGSFAVLLARLWAGGRVRVFPSALAFWVVALGCGGPMNRIRPVESEETRLLRPFETCRHCLYIGLADAWWESSVHVVVDFTSHSIRQCSVERKASLAADSLCQESPLSSAQLQTADAFLASAQAYAKPVRRLREGDSQFIFAVKSPETGEQILVEWGDDRRLKPWKDKLWPLVDVPDDAEARHVWNSLARP